MRAVFYARVSTEEERQLNAIELQIEENKKAIAAKGWILVDEYIDRGKSGTKQAGRDEYQRLLADMQLDKFDVVVAKDQDRLQRNTLDWYLFSNAVIQTGKKLYLYLDNKFSTPDDALITGIKAIIAEEFSRNLSKKIKNYNKGRLERARTGDTSILLHSIDRAFGWTRKGGEIVLVPEQAKIRRLAIDLTLQGKGSTEVAKILNSEGYRNTVGKEWTTQDIPRLVYDEKNIGTVILNQKTYDFERKKNIYTDPAEWIYLENAIPPIITREEYIRLMQIKQERTTIDRRHGKKMGKSPLSGKIICGGCGAPYWRKANQRKGQEFWVCSTKQTKGRKTRARDAVNGKAGDINPLGCDSANYTTDDIMGYLDAAVLMFSANTEAIKADMIERLTTIKKRLVVGAGGFTEQALKKEQDRKSKLLSGFLDGVVSEADYRAMSAQIEDRIDGLRREMALSKERENDIAEVDRAIQNIDAEISAFLSDNKDLAVNWLLEKMSRLVIYPDGIEIHIPELSKAVVIKNIQYVEDRNPGEQFHDRALHHDALPSA